MYACMSTVQQPQLGIQYSGLSLYDYIAQPFIQARKQLRNSLDSPYQGCPNNTFSHPSILSVGPPAAIHNFQSLTPDPTPPCTAGPAGPGMRLSWTTSPATPLPHLPT